MSKLKSIHYIRLANCLHDRCLTRVIYRGTTNQLALKLCAFAGTVIKSYVIISKFAVLQTKVLEETRVSKFGARQEFSTSRWRVRNC